MGLQRGPHGPQSPAPHANLASSPPPPPHPIPPCRLATEVIGSAIAILLLTRGAVPLWGGILLSAAGSFALLAVERFGVRHLEALFAALISVMVRRAPPAAPFPLPAAACPPSSAAHWVQMLARPHPGARLPSEPTPAHSPTRPTPHPIPPPPKGGRVFPHVHRRARAHCRGAARLPRAPRVPRQRRPGGWRPPRRALNRRGTAAASSGACARLRG
jgi:hypothetical protein